MKNIKLKITKSEFTRLYLTMSVRDFAKHLGISTYMLYKYVKSMGLKKPLGRRKYVKNVKKRGN